MGSENTNNHIEIDHVEVPTNSPTANGSELTPAIVQEASFGTKVQEVDTALKSRSAAQKDIKTAWAGVVQVLQKYGVDAPRRRPDASEMAYLTKNVEVYQPLDPRLEDKAKVELAAFTTHHLGQLLDRPKTKIALETRFPGFLDWASELQLIHFLAGERRKVDKEATEAARAEVREAISKCIDAIEAHNDTVEKVANVKEYIDVVKSIAEISAIAGGRRDGDGRP